MYCLTCEYPNGEVESIGEVYPHGDPWINESQAHGCAMDYAPAGWDVVPPAVNREVVPVDAVVAAMGEEGLDPWAINRVLAHVDCESGAR